jgi:hypothetical protein
MNNNLAKTTSVVKTVNTQNSSNSNNNNASNNISNSTHNKGLVKKTSQRVKKEKPQPNKPKSKTSPNASVLAQALQTTNSENQKIKFNMKKNVIDKFYSAQLASTNALSKITKSGPIDLGSIPDLPEIPLEHLIGIQ